MEGASPKGDGPLPGQIVPDPAVSTLSPRRAVPDTATSTLSAPIPAVRVLASQPVDNDAATEMFSEIEEQEMDALEIKARTMYRMIEEITIGNSKKKLLFLTNDQAELLSSTPGSISKVLEAFELPKPKLVINLLKSLGCPSWYDVVPGLHGGLPSLGRDIWKDIESGNAPWLSVTDSQKAMEDMVVFMQDVLIPMAAETNAVIICNSNQNECMLTTALSHALYLTRSKWPGELPFSLLASGCDLINYYLNPNEDATWRQMRRKSAHWRRRDKLYLDLVAATKVSETTLDIDDIMPNLIIIDAVDERKGLMNQRVAWGKFMTEINRELTTTLPSVCFKTGMTIKTGFSGFAGAAAVEHALNAAMSGSPVVLLDHRRRPSIVAADRLELLEKGKEAYTAQCRALMGKSPPVSDNHDVCALAFFHDVLFGTTMIRHVDNNPDDGQKKVFVPMCLAIQQHLHQELSTSDPHQTKNPYRPATREEVSDVIDTMTQILADDMWALMPADLKGPLEERGVTPAEHFHAILYRINLLTKQLYSQETLHSLNFADVDRAQQLIRELVKLDRLPKEEPLEGLLLLRDAWDEYDVTMSLANHYKIVAKVTYVLLLVFGIAIIACTVFQQQFLAQRPSEEQCSAWVEGDMTAQMLGSLDVSLCGNGLGPDAQLGHSVFLLSLISSLLLSVIGFLNPAARWRQLRTSACGLESMVWLYRARVGPYAQNVRDVHASKNSFRESLSDWREELVSGTDLQNTKLERKHSPGVYCHYQYSAPDNAKISELVDDFYSPVKPEVYLQRRLQPIKEFYQKRIPERVRWRSALQFIVFLASATGASLSYFEQPSYIAIVSAFASAVTSWQEFSDAGRKIERYTGSVRHIKNLMSWWNSLGEVEKASSENIHMLLLSGESIITNEHRAWLSTAAAKRQDKQTGEEGGEGRKEDKNEKDQ